MEGRMKKYVQVSPERAKVWAEKSPKYHYYQQKMNNQKVSVVYYLCRNQQLEQPHFMEVPLSSTDGLYLRDVIERLSVLRGRGMASMYSWSCKRSYKNGFVWHDLSDNDLIAPPHGNEYVLKGSELFQDNNFGRFSPFPAITTRDQKALPEPPASISQEETSSSTNLSYRPRKSFELSPLAQHSHSLAMSPDSIIGKTSSCNDSSNLTEYKVYRNESIANASTQTEENIPKTIGSKENEISISVSQTPSIPTSFGTLQSLIKADAKKFNSSRILEDEEFRMPSSRKFKASTMILQLLSCGSIPMKNQSFGIIPNYKTQFLPSEFPSPLYSTPVPVGELDENASHMGMRLEATKNFSGSLFETSIAKEEVSTLTRSSSYNADRPEKFVSAKDEEAGNGVKCIPLSIKASFSRQPKSESMRSSISQGSIVSSYSSQIKSPGTPNGCSNRMNSPLSVKNQSSNCDENVVQVDESLLQELES